MSATDYLREAADRERRIVADMGRFGSFDNAGFIAFVREREVAEPEYWNTMSWRVAVQREIDFRKLLQVFA